jgi:alpha/beta hydrolase family protein
MRPRLRLRSVAGLAACLSCTPTTPPLRDATHAPQGSTTDDGVTSALDEIVSVGEHRMYLHCEGEGRPLVVFESGFGPGGDSSIWRRVLPLVARDTRACAYDRVGQGRSSRPVPHPHSMLQMARELRALLHATQQDAPFVVVGHSMGGPVARWLEMEYPDNVVGMVLVDATTAASANDAFSTVTAEMLRGWEETIRRLEGQDREDVVADLESLRAAGHTLGARPLITIIAGRPAANLQLRQALRLELETLSSNAVHIVAKQSGHLIPLEQAQLVADATLTVVEAARSGESLSCPQLNVRCHASRLSVQTMGALHWLPVEVP